MTSPKWTGEQAEFAAPAWSRAAAGGRSKSVSRGIRPEVNAWPATTAPCRRQGHLEAARVEADPVELPLVDGGGGRHDEAVAERVLASRIERHAGAEPALRRERRERAVVIGVAVAQDQGVRPRGVDPERPVVVGEVELREAEVEEDLPALRAARGLQVVGEPVLGQEWRRGAERGALDRDGAELARAGEHVVEVVDDVRQDQAVDRRHRRAELGRRRSTAGET